jgi:putative heme-binding domain-containing protein
MRTIFVILTLVGMFERIQAAEPWTDKRLPESERAGLVVWLDASAQAAARQALGKPVLVESGPVDVWFDGSGGGRHFGQRREDSRPMLRDHGGTRSLLFDGEKDVLTWAGMRQEYKELTVFIVAAPASSVGDFRAFLSGHETGKNDYTSGLNIDQGPGYSANWNFVNAEGNGFGGVVNLMNRAFRFGEFHQVSLIIDSGNDGVRMFVDGRAGGKRRRAAGGMRVDEMAVGARIYNNEGGAPNPRGFFDGDIAEVLVYDRALDDAERTAVEKYLGAKYANVKPAPVLRQKAPGAVPLVAVKDPPPVQMLIPGFTVRQLPVDLPNINNVRYRADGKLVALGYDGNVYLLSDSKGDGLEDTVTRFWENKGQIRAPIGMALTPPGYSRGNGLFVACKGKLTLLVDSHGGDVADKEIVVAEGWKELSHGVDALGVALDKEGNIYFGLGCADFTNAYLIGKDGKAAYDIKSERGTILRVSPDFKKREIIATGIRFPVGLAFNHFGDLFATDQEGATWLANGNPLDELLHIQKGRHYGFPPRHPKYLPGVIDEPSTFDYGPQHQSTCGLQFDESVNGGPIFGPSNWTGDAIIAAYSRGKLYRTQLVKTAEGYVAQTQLLACLNMLAVDACVSPKGDLVVAVHSGLPDWGSGPSGKGKLYKISFTGRDEPQPTHVWSGGIGEVRVAFDRPLDPMRLVDLVRNVRIERGAYVRAGDRFESLRPGYAAVQQQLRSPRYEVPVLATSVSADRRTLIFSTPPQTAAEHYALTLPGWGRTEKTGQGELPQQAAIDVDYDLCGVQAEWQGESGAGWRGWLPHLSLDVSRAMTRGSAEHDDLWQKLKTPGRLTLRTKLNLWQMLRPAVQPGSHIDYEWPRETVTIHIASNRPVSRRGPQGFSMTSGGELSFQPTPNGDNQPDEILVNLTTGPGDISLTASYSTNEDSRRRPIELRRFLLPWAEMKPVPVDQFVARDIPELKGGSWTRGRDLFYGEQAQCAKCHKVRGLGGEIGPDLSNLIHRDYDSVLRDIRYPSAAINPDYLSYVVELNDGKSYTGVLRTRGKKLVIADQAAHELTFDASDVESMRPSAVSTMPEGLDRLLGPEKLRDLLTFLLTEPLQAAPLEIRGEPPPRTRAEVEAVLKDTPQPPGPFRKLHVLLATGPKDHGPGEHDYPLWRRRWVKLFDLAPNVVVSECDGWPSPALIEKSDLIVFYSNNPGWNPERAKELDAFFARGGGAVFIHYAVDGHADVDALASRIGLAWKGGASKFRHGALDLAFPNPEHPITKGFKNLKLIDETYWNLIGDPAGVTLLASGNEDGKPQPLFWVREQGKGRIFVSIPGHYTWSFDDPLFRLLLLRGMAWAASEPTERFQSLIWPGARIAIQ